MTRVLVTGAAGFIGFHLSRRLLADGNEVVGLDNLNNYYDVRLKEARLELLRTNPRFEFAKVDLADRSGTERVFSQHRFGTVVNLAAQAGVRYSLVNPHAYVETNVVGFLNVLEGCRHTEVKHLVFASSSSVYGANTRLPFSTRDNVDHPVSLYAASKKANELMAHSYAHLYGLPCTGLRFFTVYGPWGRPDMALFTFTKAILAGRPIDLYNYGRHRRDFTYIDDIVEGIARSMNRPATPNPGWDGGAPDPSTSAAPYRLYNIGHSEPVELLRVVELLESALGRKAEKRMLPMQQGDVLDTYADIDDLAESVGYRPTTPIEDGLARFVSWYLEYFRDARA